MMRPLARALNRLLRPLGLAVRRLPPRGRAAAGPAVDPEEVATLEDELNRFAASRPPGAGLSDAGALRAYLTDTRIAFFHEAVDAAEALGVGWDEARVVDAGSGTGVLLWMLERTRTPAALAGFDSFAEVNGLARQLCPRATITDGSLFEATGTVDVVVCTEVLEHLVDPEAAIRHLAGLLAPGGALVLTVPDGREDRHPAVERREDGTGYWGHIHFWSPESWPLFLRAALGEGAEIKAVLLEAGKNLGVVWPDGTPASVGGQGLEPRTLGM